MTTEREEQLLRDGYAAGITQPRELANFMAQVGHESGGLRRLEESFRYTHSAEQISGNVRSALQSGRSGRSISIPLDLLCHSGPLTELTCPALEQSGGAVELHSWTGRVH